MDVDPAVWPAVAAELRTHRAVGLGRLLTEDTVRFATVRALVTLGADPLGLRVEWPHPALPGSRIDLVTGGVPPTAVIEFKYPREPNEKNAAWTMALGEVLKDLYRLAVVPGDIRRIFVLLETSRLRTYLKASAGRYGLDLDVDHVLLSPEAAATLPRTAAVILGEQLAVQRVTAHRTYVEDIDSDLRLTTYEVDCVASKPSSVEVAEALIVSSPSEPPSGKLELLAVMDPVVGNAEKEVSQPARDGVRHEILEAIRRVTMRSGSDRFSLAEIVLEMRRTGTAYAESTIRTMVSSHLCANATDHAAVTYDDLERIDRGVYRLLP